MSDEPRQQALARIDELVTLLKAGPDQRTPGSLVDELEQLKRAVQAFHLEGIRFRAFTLNRRLQDPATAASDQARRLFDEVRASLAAAGFQIRSH